MAGNIDKKHHAHLATSLVAEMLDNLHDKKLLVIGDVMLDQFVDGVVNRMSPEAPVPVLSRSHTQKMPGGAANVAGNLAHLGLEVILIGLVGNDAAGQDLQAELAKLPRLLFMPVQDESRPTTQKIRFRSGGQQMLRVDDESTQDANLDIEAQIIARTRALIDDVDAIILSDYAKGCLTQTTIQNVIKAAGEAGKAVILDPKSPDFGLYKGADILTPNLSELCKAAGRNLTNHQDIATAAIHLCQMHDIGHMLVTLSGDGMMLVSASDEAGDTALHLPAKAVEVFDVSGAGDTVVAALSAGLVASLPVAKAMSLANLAAGIVVGKSGTAIVSPGELLAENILQSAGGKKEVEDDTSTPLSGPDNWEQLVQQTRLWQNQGLHVGITNGCFDLLHPGHLHVIRQAATYCDKLIVAINTDRSVKILKGPSRPQQNQTERMAVLQHLPAVSAVVVFDEETPAALFEALRPNVLIKGGDYKAEELVGYDQIIGDGGAVHIIDTLPGHSTTNLLES
ncbi:MAG: D-glycero-beta-D-manno-heptose-7-phosphate kinase [Candidatus Puniceispirillaceae bacterium]